MLSCQKHLFQLDPEVHFLNCAYKSPLLRSAEQGAIQALIRNRNPYKLSMVEFFDDVENAKVLFGKLINCQPENVAIIPSVSYGFASALKNIKPNSKKKAVTIKDVFPSGYFALNQWCLEHNNTLEVISPDSTITLVGEQWNNKILEAIDEDTSIVMLPHVHWVHGLKFDLIRIGKKCKQMGARLLVDGTQSVGALAMDIEAFLIDVLVCASYKWLFGPYSMGFVYLSDSFKDGTPLEESWMNKTNARDFSSLTDYDTNYLPMSGRYNVGETSKFVLMPILIEGLKQLHIWTVPEIELYCKNLIRPILEFQAANGILIEDEKYFANHLFAVRAKEGSNVSALKNNLLEKNIITSVRGEYIRISVNVFNDRNDIAKLLEVLQLG